VRGLLFPFLRLSESLYTRSSESARLNNKEIIEVEFTGKFNLVFRETLDFHKSVMLREGNPTLGTLQNTINYLNCPPLTILSSQFFPHNPDPDPTFHCTSERLPYPNL